MQYKNIEQLTVHISRYTIPKSPKIHSLLSVSYVTVSLNAIVGVQKHW